MKEKRMRMVLVAAVAMLLVGCATNGQKRTGPYVGVEGGVTH